MNICDKIKDFVIWLNSMGFETTDSGDGSNYENGMEGALEFPMVAIQVKNKEFLISETDRLVELLKEKININQISIESTYFPINHTALILILDHNKTNILYFNFMKKEEE